MGRAITITGSLDDAQALSYIDYLLYAKIGRIAWRHPAIPIYHLTTCQNVNFCKFAYNTLIINNYL